MKDWGEGNHQADLLSELGLYGYFNPLWSSLGA
mgnify:CR=1 FL=1